MSTVGVPPGTGSGNTDLCNMCNEAVQVNLTPLASRGTIVSDAVIFSVLFSALPPMLTT